MTSSMVDRLPPLNGAVKYDRPTLNDAEDLLHSDDGFRSCTQHIEYKFGKVRPCGFQVMRTDRLTDRQTIKRTYSSQYTVICVISRGGEVTKYRAEKRYVKKR